MKNYSTHKFNFSLNFVYTFLLILLLPLYQSFNGQTLNFNDWTRHGIVLDVGAPGTWDDEIVGFASVIFENPLYKMWYSGTDGSTWRIGYATSSDGMIWDKLPNPVLYPGPPGSWDNIGVAGPNVIFIDTVYHMWYSTSEETKIGHATSPDGIDWTKDPDNPVLEGGLSGSWDYYANGGIVIFESDTFHMWYTGWDALKTNVCVGYATATNPYGKSWTKDMLHNPVLEAVMGEWDYPAIYCGSVAILDNNYYMFYEGGGINWDAEIGLAKSNNKVEWERYSDPVFTKGQPGSWDSYWVGRPTVLLNNSVTQMWYTGGTGVGVGKIGYATGPAVPVELISFTATSQLGKVILYWSTATEINNLGFEIERKIIQNENKGEWVRMGFIEGHGTTTEPKEYSYLDDISTVQATSLDYRLKQMDFLGTYEYSDEVTVENPAPVDYVLYQSYPNPFNPTTTITFGIPIKTHVVLKVFNAVGEEVAQLYNGEKEAGRYSFEFSAAGLPSGVYFYQLKTENYVKIKKMILMK